MRLLGIFAHPDDESFGPGGTFAYYGINGHTTGLVTLTRGEAGSLGISRELSPSQLARRRSAELTAAADILNIDYLRIYDLPDKKLANTLEGPAMEILRSEIESFLPDIVITFHKKGISGHPDHLTVTRWVRQTIDRIERKPALLCFGITTEQAAYFPRRKLFPITPSEITHRLDVSALLPVKIQAIRCHETQQELWKTFDQLGRDYSDYARYEHFVQLRPLPGHRNIHTDLFAGLS